MQQEKEDELFQKRMIELSKKAERTYAEYYTDFLNLNEMHLLYMVLMLLLFKKIILFRLHFQVFLGLYS